MFQLRRTAFKLLSSHSRPILSKPRPLSTVSRSVLRPSTVKPTSLSFQGRWKSSEAEIKGSDEEEKPDEHEGTPPIAAEEPTPEQEAEDQMHADNAVEQSPAIDEVSTSPREEPYSASTSGTQPESSTDTTVESMKEIASDAAESFAGRARAMAGMGAERFRPESGVANPRGVQTEPKSTVYVGNLFFDVTEDDLSQELSRFGSITSCRLIRDARGLSKGFGYVDFETISAATKAIEAMHQQLFEGRRLVVQYAAYTTRQLDNERTGFQRSPRPHSPVNSPSRTLFIGNMSFEMTDRDLHSLFRAVNNVTDIRVAVDRRTGQPRGFAHADFVDVQSATEAMKILETKETYGRKLRIDYSYTDNMSPRNRSGANRERGIRSEGSSDRSSMGSWSDDSSN